MEDFLTTSNIVFIVGILGSIFTVYNYFKEPQIKSEKIDALIQQKMEFTIKSTEERFNQMQKNFEGLLLSSNNHVHTVDTKVDKLREDIGCMGREVTRLATIIEERIPKKIN